MMFPKRQQMFSVRGPVLSTSSHKSIFSLKFAPCKEKKVRLRDVVRFPWFPWFQVHFDFCCAMFDSIGGVSATPLSTIFFDFHTLFSSLHAEITRYPPFGNGLDCRLPTDVVNSACYPRGKTNDQRRANGSAAVFTARIRKSFVYSDSRFPTQFINS